MWQRRTTVVVALLAALNLAVAVAFLVAAPTTASLAGVALALLVVPMSTGLSVLVSRRPEGATVGVLLGFLSLAVSHVVAKEVWLQWLAADGNPRDWAWLVAVTA